jgi:hypothetical protein
MCAARRTRLSRAVPFRSGADTFCLFAAANDDVLNVPLSLIWGATGGLPTWRIKDLAGGKC